MKVRYNKTQLIKIKRKVLVQVCGHPIDIIDRPCLTKCLALQATLRCLHGKHRSTDGYKAKELAALTY